MNGELDKLLHEQVTARAGPEAGWEDKEHRQEQGLKTGENSSLTSSSSIPLINSSMMLATQTLLRNDFGSGELWKAGHRWCGLWNRDTSHTVELAGPLFDPAGAKTSLNNLGGCLEPYEGKFNIKQFPECNDFILWVNAIYQYYLYTGDIEFLEKNYHIAVAILDYANGIIYDKKQKLYRGSYYYDGYPAYPFGIYDKYRARCAGACITYSRAHDCLAKIGKILNQPENIIEQFSLKSKELKKSLVEVFWNDEKGHFDFYVLEDFSQRNTNFVLTAHSLAIRWGMVDDEKKDIILKNLPWLNNGITEFSPGNGINILGENKVLNNTNSLMIQGLRDKKYAGVFSKIFYSMLRNCCRELNFSEASSEGPTGHSGMLWNAMGHLSLFAQGVFGLKPELDGLHIDPFVPTSLHGTHLMKNIKYRDAILNFSIQGSGYDKPEITLNGKVLDSGIIPVNIKGNHDISIKYNNHKDCTPAIKYEETLTNTSSKLKSGLNARFYDYSYNPNIFTDSYFLGHVHFMEIPHPMWGDPKIINIKNVNTDKNNFFIDNCFVRLFAAKIEGFIDIKKAGRYNFSIRTGEKNGVRLFLGKRLIINSDGPLPERKVSGSIELSEDKHPISIEFFTGDYMGFNKPVLNLLWSRPSFKEEIIPESTFYCNM